MVDRSQFIDAMPIVIEPKMPFWDRFLDKVDPLCRVVRYVDSAAVGFTAGLYTARVYSHEPWGIPGGIITGTGAFWLSERSKKITFQQSRGTAQLCSPGSDKLDNNVLGAIIHAVPPLIRIGCTAFVLDLSDHHDADIGRDIGLATVIQGISLSARAIVRSVDRRVATILGLGEDRMRAE